MGPQDHVDPTRATDAGLPRATARRIAGITVALLLVCSLGSLFSQTWSLTLGIVIGGLLSLANFGLLNSVIEGLVQGRQSPASVVSLTIAKLGLVGVILALSVFVLNISLFGLALGLSLIAVAVVLSPVAERLAPRQEPSHG